MLILNFLLQHTPVLKGIVIGRKFNPQCLALAEAEVSSKRVDLRTQLLAIEALANQVTNVLDGDGADIKTEHLFCRWTRDSWHVIFKVFVEIYVNVVCVATLELLFIPL